MSRGSAIKAAPVFIFRDCELIMILSVEDEGCDKIEAALMAATDVVKARVIVINIFDNILMATREYDDVVVISRAAS